jgi:PilZ domain
MPQLKRERRGLVRRSRQHSSWITIENDIRSHECRVLDVSANGAKLLADIDAPIGSKLRLSIVPHAIVRRECEVVWRKGRMIGVKFAVSAAPGQAEEPPPG